MRSMVEREMARLDRDDNATPQMPHTVSYLAPAKAQPGIKTTY